MPRFVYPRTNVFPLRRIHKLLLERYIYRELSQKLFWTVSLLLIVLASDKLIRFLTDAASGKLPGNMVFTMLGYKILAGLPNILPVALLIAILLAFTQMARNKELVILSVAGLGNHFHTRIIFRFAAVYALCTALLCFYLEPWADAKIDLLKEKILQEASISAIIPGIFQEFGKDNYIVYVETLSEDKRTMENVFLSGKIDGKSGILKSSTARFEFDKESGHRFIVFENGHHYIGNPGAPDYRIIQYQTHGMLLGPDKAETGHTEKTPVYPSELWNSDIPSHKAKMHWQFSLIIACFLLALFAAMLNQFIIREQFLTLFTIAILVYLIYSNLLSVGANLIKREIIPSYIGLWWVHLLFIAGIALLYYLPDLKHWRNPGVKR